uniref:START domain-containing protein n=1 Tax=Arundo donax TaxID=35708 RepID=A0A0A9HLG0_ARUDO
MGYVLSAVARVLEQPTAWGAAWEMALLAGPLWAAALIGLLLGWAWRPRWAAGLVATADGRHHTPAPAASFATLGFWRAQLPARLRAPLGYAGAAGTAAQLREEDEAAVQGSSEMANEELAVGKDDLVNLWRLVEGRDGGPAWIKMMEKTLPTFTYQAWRRDAQTGPPQYQSSTIFENATPEEVRDFFGDDNFRMSNKWDDMLIYHKTLEGCQTTGTMKVHWVRKFPFFCSDREYIIARRIWKLGGAYYCVTKGIPCSSIPRRNKPRRVDLYYSSWCIRAVESKRGNNGLTACEILLFHHEDMGIPYEIAKLGIRQGMWGCVKRIEPGLRAYQKARAASEPLSQSALMAQINTKVGDNFVRSLECNSDESEIMEAEEKPGRNNVARFLVLGGAVALACTLDQGLLTKALIFGVARKFVGQRKTL